MNKKVATAINELKQQYDQCDLLSSVNSGWKATTGSLIGRYTGQESEFYEEYLIWRRTTSGWGETSEEFAARQQAKAKFLIAHTIQHIERFGLYSAPKQRVFEKLADWQTALAIITIAGVIFSAGYKTGEVFESKQTAKEQVSSEAELDSFKRGLKFLPVLSDSTRKKTEEKPQRQDSKKIKKDSIHN